jgi:hypothetical protein
MRGDEGYKGDEGDENMKEKARNFAEERTQLAPGTGSDDIVATSMPPVTRAELHEAPVVEEPQ